MKKNWLLRVVAILFTLFLAISVYYNLKLDIKDVARINLQKSSRDVDITDKETIKYIGRK